MRLLKILFILILLTPRLQADDSTIFNKLDVETHTFDLTEQNSKNAGIRSIFVPGWGQWFYGDKQKGSLIFGTTLAAGTLALLSYNKSLNSYDDYKDSGRVDDSKYDDYTQERTASIVLTSLVAVLWGYSIFDAFRHREPAPSAQDTSIQLSMNSEGTDVTWQRKF